MKINRILDNITINPETHCWEWGKSCSSSGYGQLTEKGRYWNTHVYSWCLHNGEIPFGSLVRHSCHNRKCCNPDHLSLGTYKDNWRDSKEVHLKACAKRRLRWSVLGKEYPTCRDAVNLTGISMSSIIKYTKQGVFDEEAYRLGCIKGRRRN